MQVEDERRHADQYKEQVRGRREARSRVQTPGVTPLDQPSQQEPLQTPF